MNNIEKVLEIFKIDLLEKYKNLEVEYYYNLSIKSYELIFFGERYQYNKSFWNEVGDFIFENFTLKEIYVSYYYTPFYCEKVEEHKKKSGNNQTIIDSIKDRNIQRELKYAEELVEGIKSYTENNFEYGIKIDRYMELSERPLKIEKRKLLHKNYINESEKEEEILLKGGGNERGNKAYQFLSD